MMAIFKAKANATVDSILGYRYHVVHRAKALRILRVLEAQNGRTDSALIRLSNEYAADVLGSGRYAPWLYVYSAFNKVFKEGWIPDNYYGAVVDPKLKGDLSRVSLFKSLSCSLFKSDAFPDIASFVNGGFFTRDQEWIDESQIAKHLLDHSERIVFKLNSSSQGRNVYFLDAKSFNVEKIRHLGNGVFQAYIDQHEMFEQITPESVATLRMTTAVDDSGVAAVRACYLRFGRRQDTHCQSSSHIRVPVDLKSGRLNAVGHSPEWRPLSRHPDGGVAFEGMIVPHIDRCAATAVDLQSRLPCVRCIGWDMAIDKLGNVKVMEWNGGHNDIKYSEATQGPCFTDLRWHDLWRWKPG